MAACKKKVAGINLPQVKKVVQADNPSAYYDESPAWVFSTADKECWAFSENRIGNVIWSEIIPYLQNIEPQKWKDILVTAKKQNHSIQADSLNKAARDRLTQLHLELDSIVSLRITGNHRLYGYLVGRVFCLLWYDDDHGDNADCVCRSHLKHT